MLNPAELMIKVLNYDPSKNAKCINARTEDIVVLTEVGYLECLLLKEGQCIRKDIQSFYSLPIGCM